MGTSSSSTFKCKPQYHEPEPLPAKVTKKSAISAPQRGKKAPTGQPNSHQYYYKHHNHHSHFFFSTLGLLPAQATTRTTHMRGSVHSQKCTYGNDGS